MPQLWEALPPWEQLGSEILLASYLGSYALPGRLHAQALEKRLPDTLLQAIVGRPELS